MKTLVTQVYYVIIPHVSRHLLSLFWLLLTGHICTDIFFFSKFVFGEENRFLAGQLTRSKGMNLFKALDRYILPNIFSERLCQFITLTNSGLKYFLLCFYPHCLKIVIK